MIRDILIIAQLTWREVRRRKIMWTALGLGLALVGLFTLSVYLVVRDMRQYLEVSKILLNSGFSMLLMTGFYAISFLGVMLAVLTSVGTLAGEVSTHTIQSLAVKPYRRGVLVLGKWLGLSALLSCYITLLCAGITLGTWLITRHVPSNLVQGVLLICLQAIVMVTLGICGGTRLSTVANGVVAFMLWGLAFIGGWMEQIGGAVGYDALVNVGIVSSLLVPSEALWKMAAARMQPPLVNSLMLTPFAQASPPSTAMLVYALLYIAVLVGLAVRGFSKRDL